MKKLLLLLTVLALTAQSQTTIQVRRGNAADRPAGSNGEPMFDRDSLMFWVYSADSSRHIPIGGRYVNFGILQYGVDAQGSDTYVVTLPNFQEVAYWAGMTIRFKANTANTGAATININGLGAKSITKNGASALDDNDISASQVVTLIYDGTQFQLQGSTAGGQATKNFQIVPEGALGVTTSTFPAALNDTITFFALYVKTPIKLGEASVASGTLSGSCAVRTFGVAIYNSSLAIVDSTAATAWPGNGTGGTAAFQVGARLTPGFYYVAFTTYNDGSCNQLFRAPDVTNNTIVSGILSSQNASLPIIGYASESLTSGVGWPSTITVNKSTTTTLYPYIYIAGTDLD